jgi:hypothetical protein
MLHQVGVGPYLLVGVAGQTRVAIPEEPRGVGKVVITGLPAGTVADGTAYLTEELATALHIGLIQVAGGGLLYTAVVLLLRDRFALEMLAIIRRNLPFGKGRPGKR